MYDVIKVSSILGAILGICAIGEIIAEYMPWLGCIGAAALIVYGMARLYRRGWKNN